MNPDKPLEGWLQAERHADYTLWLPGDVPMFFRRVPGKDWKGGNRFRIGQRGVNTNEEPVHEVTLAEPGYFYMATFPVTQQQYRAVAELCPDLKKAHPSSRFKDPYRPVEKVCWDDALVWCDWILEHTDAVQLMAWDGTEHSIDVLSLPWESAWEIACRAGTSTEYHSGDGEAALMEAGWLDENEVHSVGGKKPNNWGLYDTHGIVKEWCLGESDENGYVDRVDGEIVSIANVNSDSIAYRRRVMRGNGGAWGGLFRSEMPLRLPLQSN